MKRLFTLLALGLVASFAPAQEAAKPKNIDIAICLDVSNSMDGLIGSAKAKLWDIINETAKIKPTPNLRVALYSYGNDGYDRNVGWVRRELELTNDLDALYQKLFALSTHGGTEYVTRVCRDAVNDLKWDDSKDSLKIIFVCGNEPANQDPTVSLQAAADLAKNKKIFINPIFCGPENSGDAQSWKQFAGLTGGKFMAIDQSRNVVAAIATPVDAELAKLTAKISETYLAYGGDRGKEKQEAQKTQNENSAKLGASVSAARAYNLANGLYQAQDWCLVDKSIREKGKFDVNKLPEADLPDLLKKLTPEKRSEYVNDLAAKRETIQKQILQLNQKRDEFIRNEQKKNPEPANRAFDDALRATIRSQAEAQGIAIPKE